MVARLDTSILQILKPTGETVGTGFLVTPDLAVTCAHIIKQASAEPGSVIKVKVFEGSQELDGIVEEVGYSPVEDEDIAFIKISKMQGDTLPVSLGSASGAAGHRFITLGFPATNGEAIGRRASGEISGLLPGKQPGKQILQIIGDQLEPGFSGAPLLDEEWSIVVGMVTWGQDRPYVRVVHAVPAEAIVKYCPQPLVLAETSPDGDFFQTIYEEFERVTNSDLRKIRLQIPGLGQSIQRLEVGIIEDQLALGKSVVLVGDAGNGKSGVGYFLAKKAISEGKAVLFFDARRFAFIKSESELSNS